MNSVLRVGLGILIIVAGLAAVSSMFTVHEREQALVIQFGQPQRVIQEPGLYFKLPLIQNVEYMDKRVLDYDARAVEVPTLDQKQLIVDAFTRYRIVDPLRYYQAVRTEASLDSRLGPIMDASLRQTLGNVPMLRILTEERAELMDHIQGFVNTQATQLGINVIDVRVKRVDLPKENSEAVFRQMQTQREQEARGIRAEGERDSRQIRAEADKQVRVIVAEARKNAEILRGEGDAEGERIYINAYGQDPEFFDFWRSMQALSKGLGQDTTSFVGSPNGDFFRFFGDVSGGAGATNRAASGGAALPAGGTE